MGSMASNLDFRASVVDELEGELRMDDEEDLPEGDGAEEFELDTNLTMRARDQWLDVEEPLEDAHEPVASGSGFHY